MNDNTLLAIAINFTLIAVATIVIIIVSGRKEKK